MSDERLKRFGTEPESVAKLAEDAARAETILGIHGVSVTGRSSLAPGGACSRAEIEKLFRVHDTPTRRDKLHRTIELPKPVTSEVAERFNRLFGRGAT